MQSEQQELIEAAQRVLDAPAGDLMPYVWLRKALELARASEGGWIDCKQELPPQGVRIEIIDIREPFPEFTADHMGVGHSDLCRWSKTAPHFTHWRIITLPSPPLSVETPK